MDGDDMARAFKLGYRRVRFFKFKCEVEGESTGKLTQQISERYSPRSLAGYLGFELDRVLTVYHFIVSAKN